MKKVIVIPEVGRAAGHLMPLELTHRKTNGWQKVERVTVKNYLHSADKVVYLGKCEEDGDMFALYTNGFIMIFKGHLNSGTY